LEFFVADITTDDGLQEIASGVDGRLGMVSILVN